MSDQLQNRETRPVFGMPVIPPDSGAGRSSVPLSFFGDTTINGPVVGRDLNVTNIVNSDSAARAEADYLFAVADVHSYWRNQYILGPASSLASPFIPTDSAALMRCFTDAAGATAGPARRLVALPDAINLYRRVLLLGGPGAGKSSYLQYLALAETGPRTTAARLPVLVDLNAWDSSGPFLPFVQAFLRDPPNPAPPAAPFHVVSPWLAEQIDTYLQTGRVLLLLDGLNELPPVDPAAESARRVALRDFFAAYPQPRAVVTCRMLDYAGELDSAGFQQVLLDPWTVEQMASYLQGRGAADLLTRLHAGDPLLLSLGQVPFLLYMLTELAANTPPPAPGVPDQLASGSALFRRFMDLLLEWATQKDEANARLFPRRAVLDALARLEAAMQAAGYRGTAVPHAWAVGRLPDPAALFGGLPPPGNLRGDPRDHLLDFGCAATILDTPATRATVRFWHLAHQDYFSALAAPATPVGPLVPADDEVHSLAAALAPQPAAAIQAILQGGDPRAPLVAAKALIQAGGG